VDIGLLAPVGAVYGLVLMDWLRSLLNWLGSLFSRGSRDDEGWIEPSNVITRAILAMDDELPPVMEPVVAEEAAPEPEPTPEPVVEPAAAEVAAPRKKSDETEEEAEEQAAEPAAEERAA